MQIKFLKILYIRLKHESDLSGKSIQQIVQDILLDHYNLTNK